MRDLFEAAALQRGRRPVLASVVLASAMLTLPNTAIAQQRPLFSGGAAIQVALPQGVKLRSETPTTAFAFLDSFAVNSHFDDAYTYGPEFSTLAPLLYSGPIRHLRDGGLPQAGNSYLARYQNLCRNGVHHSVTFHIGTTGPQMSSAIKVYGPQCIDFVEPQNEMDAYAGYGKKDPNWPKEIIAEQSLLYHIVKSTPAFANITVLGPALASPANYSQLGNLQAISDAGNSHSAMCDANPGSTFYGTLSQRVNVVKVSWPTKPIWVTETDYKDNPIDGHCAVPDDVMAKYVARTQTERFNLGETRLYWYELEDTPKEAFFGYEGLLRSNGSFKPAYEEMANLMAVIGDPAPGRKPVPINWALTGSATIHHMLLQKNNGTYELLLWNEVPSWDTVRHVRISVPLRSATVYLPPSIGTATYYAFNTSYQMVRTLVNKRGGGFTIPVSDNISVLDFN